MSEIALSKTHLPSETGMSASVFFIPLTNYIRFLTLEKKSVEQNYSSLLAAERFTKAFGQPATPAPTHIELEDPNAQKEWAFLYGISGAGWYKNGFVFLFGDRLLDLHPTLDQLADLWPDNSTPRTLIGKNAYGDLLVAENLREAGFDAPVMLVHAAERQLYFEPDWTFLKAIGELLPSMDFAFFLKQDRWFAWLETEQPKPTLEECITPTTDASGKAVLHLEPLSDYLNRPAKTRVGPKLIGVIKPTSEETITVDAKPPARPEEVIYNCHVHLFNIDYIPKYFLSRFIPITILKRKKLANALYRIARPFVHRYSAFFFSALHGNPQDILEELQYYYPKGTRFVPLSVDFDYMQAGKAQKNFHEQLKDLAQLRRDFPFTIYPFIGVDPRRAETEDLLGLVREYIEEHEFAGLKFYPSLGFFPNNPHLFPIFEYAEAHEIPITTHCIPINKNHYRGKISRDDKDQATYTPGYNKRNARSAKRFAQYYNHPYWWMKVLERYPKLKINFGHFGGAEEWARYLDNPRPRELGDESWYRQIRRFIENPDYPNVYADISFTVHDQSLYPVLKNLIQSKDTRPYVLFGSDFYMLQKDYRERRFGLDVRGYLSDSDYWQIAEINPKRFLKNTLQR